MADALLSPIRCTVYDKDNNYLGYVDSLSAKNDINPDTVRTKIDDFLSTVEENLGNISKAITNEAQPDAANSLVVVDTDTTELFTQVEEILTDGSIVSTISEAVESIYEGAVTAHNQIQEQYNENARTAAKAAENYYRMTETNKVG